MGDETECDATVQRRSERRLHIERRAKRIQPSLHVKLRVQIAELRLVELGQSHALPGEVHRFGATDTKIGNGSAHPPRASRSNGDGPLPVTLVRNLRQSVPAAQLQRPSSRPSMGRSPRPVGCFDRDGSVGLA